MRKVRYGKRDRRIFSQTANRTKAINLGAVTMRGGVRL